MAVNWTGDLLVADWVIPPVMTVDLDNNGEAEIKFDTQWDAKNEPHGLLTLRLQSASHYEIDQNAAFANVIIYDNDVEPCVEHLRSDISTGVGGGPDCPSPRVGGGGSWYYTFQLSQRLTISLDHWSSHWDPYLYLRQGRNIKDGAALYENDNGGIHGATSSRITATLDPGWYTVEATSFGARPGGGARFQISGLFPMSTKGVEVSVLGGLSVDEGSGVKFTVAAHPLPSTPVTANVEIATNGDFGVTTGTHTVTVPTNTGKAELVLSTSDDAIREDSGSITATVTDGTGYDVSPTMPSSSVAVYDNDFECTEALPESGKVTDQWTPKCRAVGRFVNSNGRFYTFELKQSTTVTIDLMSQEVDPFLLLYNTSDVSDGADLYQHDDIDTNGGNLNSRIENVVLPAGQYTIEAATSSPNKTGKFELNVTSLPPPSSDPEISIASDGDVTEGTDASFTVTASPKPAASLDVTVDVTQSGDYVTTGSQTVTITTSGTATLTVPTTNDSVDEPDGSVTATIGSGTGYTVSSGTGAATVAIADNDIPEISIASDGDVTEGTDASFTVTASPKPAASLDVTVDVTQSGDYVTTGSQTVTITTSGTATLTVPTTNDSVDEPDGSVTATIGSGTGYTVSSGNGAATVAVADNDIPEVSIAAGAGVTEGTDATFTVTADPTPHTALSVDVTVSQSGAFGAATGSRTVTIPTTGSVTFTVATTNDSSDEADGSVTATISTGTGYTVSSSASSATVAVSDDDVTALPEISIASDGDVTEGTEASFTVTASPKPAASLDATVDVTQSGDYVTTGSQTVTITTSGTAKLTVPTTDDSVDEPDGSVTATLSTGNGYSVSSSNGAATAAVADDDGVSPCTTQLTDDGATQGEWTDSCDSSVASRGFARFYTFQLTEQSDVTIHLTSSTDTYLYLRKGNGALSGSSLYQNDDIGGGNLNSRISRTFDAGWYTIEATTYSPGRVDSFQLEITGLPTQTSEPEISIAAGADITEGGDATFTVTATPNPSSDLDVTIEVSQSGDYASTGSQTVTIPTSGSYTLTVATTNDNTDEPDGSLTATINTGTGYTVSSSASSATVAVSDDDVPEISITAGSGVTEGNDATFTVTASPVPSADLDVTVAVSQSGDYVSTGTRTVTIPTSGSYTLTVATTNDNTDEPDGSVTATINTGTGYTVSSSNGAATVAVADDDDPPPATPEISITAGSGVTEGNDATFTVTASPVPSADLDVTVAVSQSGDYVSTGTQTVTIPTSGSYTLTVATTNDNTDEPDGSVTATINTGTGYTVSSSSGSATVAVSDDDDSVPDDTAVQDCVSESLLGTVRHYFDVNQNRAPSYGTNWKRVLIAFGDAQDSQLTPYTAAEALQAEQIWSGWKPVREALECIEAARAQTPEPEVTIAAGGAVTEGTDATFTVTASPVPSADLDVTVAVSQSGDYVTTGSRTVTIPSSGTKTFTVTTTDDSDDEPDGSVTATIGSGTGYTVSSGTGAATVAVADNDIPEVSIAAGAGVIEGVDATFTVTADPTPHTALSVDVTVSQSGAFGAVTGARAVTIPTTGSVTFTVATTNDSTDEADGSVTATLGGGTGYTVSTTNSAATVAVSDDDDSVPDDTAVQDCVSDSLLGTVRHYFDVNQNRAPSYGTNWKRVLIAFGDAQDSQLTPYTAAEALQSEQIWSGWKPVREALECIEAARAQTPEPEVTIAAGGAVAEGTDATFTVTASPSPTAALTVNLTVSQSGSFGAATGADTVTIPTSGSATYTVSTTNDSTDEPDGSVTATLNTGTGYTVSGTSNAATVVVSDDDDPPPPPPPPPPPDPEVSIAAGSGVTEGTDASFTLTASPAPAADLDVTIDVTQSGDYVTTGSRTVTIPSSGSKTFTVTTTDDSDDEPDGSVTATIDSGTGYTVSSSNGAATVAVADDDVCTATLPSDAVTVAEITGWRDALSNDAGIRRFNRVLAALGVDTGLPAMPADLAQDVADWLGNTRWDRIARTLAAMEQDQCDDPPPPDPEISITPGSDVTEGSDATFTVTASPSPTAALTVNLTVSQSGSFGAATGADTVTIPTSGSATYTVSTTNDSTDEPDGSVTATMEHRHGLHRFGDE